MSESPELRSREQETSLFGAGLRLLPAYFICLLIYYVLRAVCAGAVRQGAWGRKLRKRAFVVLLYFNLNYLFEKIFHQATSWTEGKKVAIYRAETSTPSTCLFVPVTFRSCGLFGGYLFIYCVFWWEVFRYTSHSKSPGKLPAWYAASSQAGFRNGACCQAAMGTAW